MKGKNYTKEGSPKPNNSKRKNSAGAGPIASILISLGLFFVLLQIFDPLASSSSTAAHAGNSAIHVGLEHFSSGHLRDFNQIEVHQSSLGRERIMQLLQEAGVDNLSPEQIDRLPKWQHVVDLYGSEVVIVGKESCDEFRQKVRLADRVVGVAGMFNTGTNLLDIHLQRNLVGVKNIWQVPWGKHRMPEVRMTHTAPDMKKFQKENVLPVVIVRDPLQWLQSMCSHPYAARWRHTAQHCPNLVPTEQDKEELGTVRDSFQVTIKYDADSKFAFDSLAHVWSEWHQQYMDAEYPLLFIRFEDLVFAPGLVLSEIADCVGAHLQDPLQFQVKTSKNHGSGTDFVKAIIKTADADMRMHNLTEADKEFAQEHLSPNLMKMFHYHSPLDHLGGSFA